jgi:hypothetical protein
MPNSDETCLAKGGSGDGSFTDEGQHILHGSTQVLLNDFKSHLIREGRHIILQNAQLVHVVLTNNVWPICQDLARLDVAWPQINKKLPASVPL